MRGRYQCGGYLPHIINCSLVDLHCTLSCSRNTTDSQLHTMISIVRLARSFVLGTDVTGACDVVRVTSPSPCVRLPHHHVGESHKIICAHISEYFKMKTQNCKFFHPYWEKQRFPFNNNTRLCVHNSWSLIYIWNDTHVYARIKTDNFPLYSDCIKDIWSSKYLTSFISKAWCWIEHSKLYVNGDTICHIHLKKKRGKNQQCSNILCTCVQYYFCNRTLPPVPYENQNGINKVIQHQKHLVNAKKWLMSVIGPIIRGTRTRTGLKSLLCII
jgi:hypothetical protein